MSDYNPYATPRANLGEGRPEDAAHFGDATNGQRFLNSIIDFVGFVGFSFLAGIVLALTGAEDLLESNFLGIGLLFLYYVLLEGLTGRTLGKLITGTRVISRSGDSASILQILGRTAIRFVPFEAFSFLGSEPGGWHDHWSNTRVVRLRPAAWQREDV